MSQQSKNTGETRVAANTQSQPQQGSSAPPEIFSVSADTLQVSCNGGGGALGHPKVYYTFHHQDEVTCGYCDRLFTKIAQAGAKPYSTGK